jgi:hypothetical protein
MLILIICGAIGFFLLLCLVGAAIAYFIWRMCKKEKVAQYAEIEFELAMVRC